MTEEETFRKLKKLSWREMDAVIRRFIEGNRVYVVSDEDIEKCFNDHGWTWAEWKQQSLK